MERVGTRTVVHLGAGGHVGVSNCYHMRHLVSEEVMLHCAVRHFTLVCLLSSYSSGWQFHGRGALFCYLCECAVCACHAGLLCGIKSASSVWACSRALQGYRSRDGSAARGLCATMQILAILALLCVSSRLTV
jgi:hypothetical protein